MGHLKFGVLSAIRRNKLLAALILFSALASAAVIDNVKISGNTISTLNSNGNLVFDLNGTGKLEFTDLDAARVLYLDNNKRLTSSTTSPTELNFLGGVDSSLCGESQFCIFTNKTIDADLNSVENIDNADIKTGAAIARDKLANGSNNHVIINNGSGVMTSEANLAISRGGTGAGTKAAGFDALSPMTASGDVIYGGASGTGTRLAKGTDGHFLTLSGGLPAWAAVSVSPTAPRSVTGTDTATISDETLYLSGSTFTETLYSASGNSGRSLYIVHSGSIGQVYTLDGSGAELIGDAQTKKLYYPGDYYIIRSNGTKWLILARKATIMLSAAGDPASATSGNPIIFPTAVIDTASMYGTGTGLATAPEAGCYRVSGAFTSTTGAVGFSVYVNAALGPLAGTADSNGEGTWSALVCSVAIGDTISLRPDGTINLAGINAFQIQFEGP